MHRKSATRINGPRASLGYAFRQAVPLLLLIGTRCRTVPTAGWETFVRAKDTDPRAAPTAASVPPPTPDASKSQSVASQLSDEDNPTNFEAQVDYLLRAYFNSAVHERYYGYLSHRAGSIDRSLKVIVAIGTTGSSISGWAVWKFGVGTILWTAIAATASVVAIIQPILNMHSTWERREKVWAAFNLQKQELRDALEDVARDPGSIGSAIKSVGRLRTTIRAVLHSDERIPAAGSSAGSSRGFRRQCQQLVKRDRAGLRHRERWHAVNHLRHPVQRAPIQFGGLQLFPLRH